MNRSHSLRIASTRTCVTMALGLLAVAVSVDTTGVRAGGLELSPYAGYYAPAADAVDEIVPQVGSLSAKNAPALAAGGRLGLWITPGFGLEFGGVYVATDFEGDVFSFSGSTEADFFFGSARLVFASTAVTGPRFHFAAGLALARSDYGAIDGTTWLAGVLGLGMRIPLFGKLGLRLDVDDYLYGIEFALDDVTTEQRLQNDFVASAGLSALFR